MKFNKDLVNIYSTQKSALGYKNTKAYQLQVSEIPKFYFSFTETEWRLWIWEKVLDIMIVFINLIP